MRQRKKYRRLKEKVYKAKYEQYGECPFWVLVISNMDALAISIVKDRRKSK